MDHQNQDERGRWSTKKRRVNADVIVVLIMATLGLAVALAAVIIVGRR